MKNFLKELYNNFPELESSKEKVDKAVYYLKDNKPFYAASDEFKIKLKTRLENISSLRLQKKSNFLIFAIPVFSFLFVVVWFTYYFKDVSFLNDKVNISLNNKIEDSVYQNEILNETQKNIENIDENIDKNLIKSDNFISTKKIEKVILDKYKVSEEKIDKVEENSVIDLTTNEKITEINVLDNINESTIENDDIFNFLEALWENLDEDQSFVSDGNMWWSSLKMIWESTPMIMSDSVNVSSFIIEDDYIWFEDFCKNNMWFIYEAGDEKVCRVDKKECLSSNYINWVCEFKEIK